MRLDDLLQVMREEFALAASDIDDSLMAWLGEGPAGADTNAAAIATLLDRLVATSRLISLEGLAVALEQLRDASLALAMLDDDTMGQGLGWLSSWREPFEAAFAAPGAAEPANALLAYLGQGPMAPPIGTLAEMRCLLVLAPALPVEAAELAGSLAPATEDDVSLALPADTDHDLYETFLADAPAQLARLSDAVRALARGDLPEARLTEAQRVAHTFKGSGSIIGIIGVARLAHRIEDLLDFALRQSGRLPPAMGRDLEQATATLDQMVYALRGEEEPPTEARAHLQRLLDWVQAIDEGRWAEGLDTPEAAGLPTALPQAPPAPAARREAAAGEAPAPSPATPSSQAPAPAEPPADGGETQLRVGVSRLDRLLRRAGQGLVQGGLMGEQLRRVDERLRAMDTLHTSLQARLAELQIALERQGVTLQEKSQAEGADFDPLEMDRYNHVQTLSRFVAELVSDEAEVAQGARNEAQRAALALRDHHAALQEQHRELLGARLVPFRQIVSRLRRTVSQTGATLQRPVRLEVTGDAAQLDSEVLERLTEPLLHLLRNAVDHGIEPPEERALYGKPNEGVVHLHVRRDGQTVHVQCSDDGRGIDLAAVHAKAVELGLMAADEEPDAQAVARLILLPGFSTRAQVTEVSGRGVGMDVVAERVRAMKGHIDIDSAPLAGTTITLRLPATTGSLHALVVDAGGERWALPTEAVIRALAADQGSRSGARFLHAEASYPLASLAHWLGLPDSPADAPSGPAAVAGPGQRPVVLVRGANGPVALQVDRVVDARELILQDVGGLLRRARGVAGGALRSDGRVLFVLDLERLDAGAAQALPQAAAAALRQRAQARRQRVLVVDDAISVRKALSQLLEDAGYEVLTARDGFDALQRLQHDAADLVLTDLEMPQLNGLDFTRQLRLADATRALPVVMITSRATDKHRQAAQEAGVSHYLTKPYADAALLTLVRQLLAPA